MLTTIILFFALMFTYFTFISNLEYLIKMNIKKEEDYELLHLMFPLICSILWAWFYYLTTH